MGYSSVLPEWITACRMTWKEWPTHYCKRDGRSHRSQSCGQSRTANEKRVTAYQDGAHLPDQACACSCSVQNVQNLKIGTVNIRYRHIRYRHRHDTGTLFRCTNFQPPNRLPYRQWHTTLQAHKIAIYACVEFWRDRLLGGDNCFKWRF